MKAPGDWQLREATAADATSLAVLLDIASRGLVGWYWGTLARPGQSPFEVGRDRIRTGNGLPSHFSNWRLLEHAGEVVGGFAGYVVPNPYDPGDISGLPDVYSPMLDLEARAVGTWHLMALAVFHEFRGQQVGRALLGQSRLLAQASGGRGMSIIANTDNEIACRLYRTAGFSEVDRRPCVPFPGSSDRGDWVLFGNWSPQTASN